MKNSLILVVFTLFLACKHDNQANGKPPDTYGSWLDIVKKNLERLDKDSMTINGRVPLITTKSELIKLLGNPDTTLAVYRDFSNDPTGVFKQWNMLYYKNLRFVTLDEGAFIQSINFKKSDIRLVHPKITLDSNTTIIQVQKMFPESGQLVYSWGSSFTGYMQLRASKSWGDMSTWFLVFEKTKLVRMDLYYVMW